ncbi:hypothetical protein GPALN_010368 [Globodera pallida]|nr:hypothetical protein GPALN_010368 [Globodera pallida]
MSQGSFSSSLFHAENRGVNQSRRGDESYQSLHAALQCENPNFSLNANLSRGAHQPPQQFSVFQNQNSGWYGSVQNQSGFLVATPSIPISGENRQSRFVSRVTDQNQVLQQEGIYLAYPSRGQPGQNQLEIRNQTAAYPNNPLVRQSRAPSRGAQVHQNMSFGVQEQGDFVEYRVLPRGTHAQDSIKVEVGQGGPGENRASCAQGSFYGYMETPEWFSPMQFYPTSQQQLQPQAFALPQPVQNGYVPQQWPNQQTAQVAQMEREMELQQVKLSGQCAKLLKELPILNGTEGREATMDFFTALETRTTEWRSEKIVEVLQIKVKGKAQKEMAAVVSRVGNTISLEILRTEVIKALYGDESLEERSTQDSEVESIDHHRSSATIEENVVGDKVEGQKVQMLQKSPPQKNFLDNLSNGIFGREIDAPKQLLLKISFTTQEISKFVTGERVNVSPLSPIQMVFSENLSPATHLLNIPSCSASLNGDLTVAKMLWRMEGNSAAKNVENGGCKGRLEDQQPKVERKELEKPDVSLLRADEGKIKALEKQLALVSNERDKLKNLVESLIESKGLNRLNRKAKKAVADKFKQVYPVEKPEKTPGTGKGKLVKKSTHSSKPKIVKNPQKIPEILVTPPTRGRNPLSDSVKVQQKKPAEEIFQSKGVETGRRKGVGRVFVNSALKRPQSMPKSVPTSPTHKNLGGSFKNFRKRENLGHSPENLHRGVRVFVNSQYKERSVPRGPPSSDPDTRAASQNSGRLNKAPPFHSTTTPPSETRAKGTQPSPQSFFQGLPATGSTCLLQQVDEDATSEGAGEDGPTAAEGSGFLEAGDVGLCWPFPYLNM